MYLSFSACVSFDGVSIIVMCLAFDAKQLTGVCGSPTNSLEAFTLSEEEVRPTSRAI